MLKLKKCLGQAHAALVSFSKSEAGILLYAALAWQAALTFLGWYLASGTGPLSHMMQWDAGWCVHIIQHAYGSQSDPAAPAFYPLFPAMVSSLHILSFGMLNYELAALLINTTSLWLILLALVRITRFFGTSRAGSYIAVIAFLCFPSALFLHVFYSEAIFVALGSWAYLLSLHRKWWAVGILLAALTAARLPALLFVALCGLQYMHSYKWDIRKALNKNVLWLILSPLGFIAYGLYLMAVRHDFLAMFQAYSATSDWSYHVLNLNIFATLGESFVTITQGPLNYELFINVALPLLTIFLILIASLYVLVVLRTKGLPLFVFGLLSIVMYTLNSNLISVHRYALACLTIFIAVALFARNTRRRIVVSILLAASLGIQLLIYSKFVSGVFAG